MSSISSVSSTPVSKPVQASPPPPPPPPPAKDDATTTPPPKAALPPGQGTRVDQLA
ncbi:hypothetical protein [Rhodopseudomonas pseudopalustris]|uniref:Uncharacterized protein n=1 Tax=Rhodopseudomonas pseudopalustris TaxID=1513892 RepID=A0A1H8UX79_9BRAD|nr:hypothetical protein [Rhodopseudomonas pseudopalustris]MBB1090905.1 hypothetical protein [Rhodopseudomonas palustris]SEP07178.1 hypothetical protein SAMN05444123_107268 [Rhodopseudomonas pseudopalustris]